MSENNLLTVQQYAVKHKMSTFAVIKLVNAKKLKIIKKAVDGEEQEFIIDETIAIQQPSLTVAETQDSSSINYEVEFHKLLAKYVELNEKYTKLIEEKNSIK